MRVLSIMAHHNGNVDGGTVNFDSTNFGFTPTATPTPTPPRSPSTRFRSGFRHGSAEQQPYDNFGRPANFRQAETPRTPRRARSPGDREDRDRDRGDWRRGAPEQPADEPVGFGFRLGSLEQSLRRHFQEIQSHRALLAELKPNVDALLENKTALEGRLDQFFCILKVQTKYKLRPQKSL